MKILKKSFELVAAGLFFLCLANVGKGVIKLIPANLPLVGNSFEFVASHIFIRLLAYLGIVQTACTNNILKSLPDTFA